MIFAHIAGLPIEESVAMVAPAAGVLGVLVGVWLRRLAGSFRRRDPGKQTR